MKIEYDYPPRVPVFTKWADGSVTVDAPFPMEMLVAPELLRTALPRFVHREGFRSFSINCANANATFRILRKDDDWNVYVCERTL